MGLFLWFSRRFLPKQTNLRENRKYQRKPKKTNKHLRENQKNKVVKGFIPTLGYGFGVLFFGFPEGFYQTKNTFEKTKIPKKTKTTLGKTKKNIILKVSDPPLDMGLFVVLCVFPKVFYKTKKPSRKPQKPKKPKKTKENQQNLQKNQKTSFQRFQTHPWIWVWFFLFLCCS